MPKLAGFAKRSRCLLWLIGRKFNRADLPLEIGQVALRTRDFREVVAELLPSADGPIQDAKRGLRIIGKIGPGVQKPSDAAESRESLDVVGIERFLLAKAVDDVETFCQRTDAVVGLKVLQIALRDAQERCGKLRLQLGILLALRHELFVVTQRCFEQLLSQRLKSRCVKQPAFAHNCEVLVHRLTRFAKIRLRLGRLGLGDATLLGFCALRVFGRDQRSEFLFPAIALQSARPSSPE